MSNQNLFTLSNPKSLHRPSGYSHMAEIERGKIIIFAGQVALNPAGEPVGPNDVRQQTEQIFTNLGAALSDIGASLEAIVKLTVYFTDIAHLPMYREVRDRFVNPANPPASTAVQVCALFRPDLLIEIEAMAVV